jgi:hypothetical protein
MLLRELNTKRESERENEFVGVLERNPDDPDEFQFVFDVLRDVFFDIRGFDAAFFMVV